MTDILRQTIIALLLILTCNSSVIASVETIKVLPLAPEKSVSTYLPSEAAPGRGLAVNIIYPNKPRYSEGAPIAVVIPGGDGPSGLNFSCHAAQAGFIEVRFSFPGGGDLNSKGAFKSGGKNDYRGPDSQLALKDVILFALGKSKDFQEKTIKDLLPIKIAPNNLGLIGWSNGGNIALVTMDKYSDLLGGINWIVFYESPLGSIFFPPSLGGINDLLSNKHYRQGSAATGRCLIDFRKLAWEPAIKRNPGVYKKLGEPEIPGVVYFDENGNKAWDESTEFAFSYCIDPKLRKQVYAPEVTAALERHEVFGGKWPPSVATLKESEAYFQERDGSLYIPSVCTKYPNLLVTIFGSHVDHLERQLDHPHIVMQYNLWLDNGAHWVRLNPEPIYLTQIANMSVRNFVDNKPNNPIDAAAIVERLEPEGVLNDYVFVDAAIAELADRKKTNNLKNPLEAPLRNYSNGLPIPPFAVPSANQAKPASTNSQ